MLSAIASIFQGNDVESVNRLVDEMLDPVGTFYRFGLPDSLLKRKHMPRSQQEVKK
jgi:F420-non-reducing hydrogenase small subunit